MLCINTINISYKVNKHNIAPPSLKTYTCSSGNRTNGLHMVSEYEFASSIEIKIYFAI